MKLNPVTVTFSRHELELIQNVLGQLAKRDTRIGRLADSTLDTIGGALKAHDIKRAHDRYFGAFWKDNKTLKYGEANESFRLILADRGEAFFQEAYDPKFRTSADGALVLGFTDE